MKTKLTKNDMARVIVQALYNSKELPATNNCNVKKQEKLLRVELVGKYKLAYKVLTGHDVMGIK